MRLTWHDAAATFFVAIAGGLYAWHLASPDAAFVGSTRWTAVSLFVLGVASCATGGNLEGTGAYSRVMSLAGGAVFALAVTTLVVGSDALLAAIALVIGVLWLVTTVRHALGKHVETPRVSALDGSHESLEVTRR